MPVVDVSNPNDEVVEPEALSGNEVVSCLWSKSATEKCRIGLADIIVYDNGSPMRWYMTGKTGEILKKKQVHLPSIRERWEKITSKAEADYIAIVRQKGGVLKFLGPEAWQTFISSKKAEPSILSAHCFIKGNNNSIFRNTFQMSDRLGRFTTTTYAYAFIKKEPNIVDRKSNYKATEADPLIVLNESNTDFIESRASSLKNIMDLATNTVIRYLENMLGVRVLKIAVDYIIDNKSQLWMLWSSDALIVRTTNLANCTIPGLAPGDRTGRMGWAGEKYADDHKTMLLDGRVPGGRASPTKTGRMSPTRSASPHRTGSPSKRNNDDNSILSYNTSGSVDHKGKVLANKADFQMSSAISTVEGAGGGTGATKKKSYLNNISVVESDNKDLVSSNVDQFPDAFKCKGEYCHIRFKMSADLTQYNKSKSHTIEKCFTSKELEVRTRLCYPDLSLTIVINIMITILTQPPLSPLSNHTLIAAPLSSPSHYICPHYIYLHPYHPRYCGRILYTAK